MSEEVCRICRGEETEEEPLFHPCKCTGSIRYVHQECLLGWIEHAKQRTKCDVCGSNYVVEKQYMKDMPQSLKVRDYLAYSLSFAASNSVYVLYFVRFLTAFSCLALLVNYSLQLACLIVERQWKEHISMYGPQQVNQAVVALLERARQQPPRRSVAPYIDAVAEYITPAHELRAAWINGVLFIFIFAMAALFCYCLTSWVITEQAVLHDLDHIAQGQPSHMDRGDDDELLEFLQNAEGQHVADFEAHIDEIVAGRAGQNAQAQQNIAAVQQEQEEQERQDRIERRDDEALRRAIQADRERQVIQEEQEEERAEVEIEANEQANLAMRRAIQEIKDGRGAEATEADSAVPAAQSVPADQADTAQDSAGPEHLVEQIADTISETISAGADQTAPISIRIADTIAAVSDQSAAEQEDTQREVMGVDSDIYADWRREEEVVRADREEDEDDGDDEERFLPIVWNLFVGMISLSWMEFAFLAGCVSVSYLCVICMFSGICSIVAFCVSAAHLLVVWALERTKLANPALVSPFFSTPPSTVLGYIFMAFLTDFTAILLLRVSVLWNMDWLLKSAGGRNLVQMAYQLYAVHKTVFMTMVESLFFPQFCGTLIHLVALPLTPSWAWHRRMYAEHPHWTYFVHWLAGYLYMHSLQIFVMACRKMFRPGVLYFLHKNDTTYFMRSMMLLSLPKQLKRISISAGIYAAFIMVGMGSVTLGLRIAEGSLWPLDITSLVPYDVMLRLWPFALGFALLNAPLRYSNRKLKEILLLWVKERVWIRVFDYIADTLDLGSWLFHRARTLSSEEQQALLNGDRSRGYFVRAPKDVPPGPIRTQGLLFVPVDHRAVRLDGKKGVQKGEMADYIVVWRPPNFRWRIAGLAAISWASVTTVVLLATLIPMRLGSIIDYALYDNRVQNDLVRTCMGLSVLLPVYAVVLKNLEPVELKRCLRFFELKGDVPQPDWLNIKHAALCVATSLALTVFTVRFPNTWGQWMVLPHLIPNFVLFFVATSYARRWFGWWLPCVIAAAQLGLEQLGFCEKTPLPERMSIILAAGSWLLVRVRHTKFASDLAFAIREQRYLLGLQVGNYEPEN